MLFQTVFGPGIYLALRNATYVWDKFIITYIQWKWQARTSTQFTPFLIGYRPASHCQERVAFCTGRIFCPLSEHRNVYAFSCANLSSALSHTCVMRTLKPRIKSLQLDVTVSSNPSALLSTQHFRSLVSSFWYWACDDSATTARQLFSTSNCLSKSCTWFLKWSWMWVFKSINFIGRHVYINTISKISLWAQNLPLKSRTKIKIQTAVDWRNKKPRITAKSHLLGRQQFWPEPPTS